MNVGDLAKKAAAAAKNSGNTDEKSIMTWIKNATEKALEQAAASKLDKSWYDKVVQQAKKELKESQLEEGFLGDKIGWVMDAAKNVADMFTKEYIDTGKMPKKEIEDLAAKAEGALPSEDEEEEVDVEVETISEMNRIPSSNVLLNEGLIFEGKVRDKVMRLLNKAGILGGLGITLGGFASFVSNIPGYVDSTFLTKVHEMIENTFNCGFACGALGFLAMVIGIAIAIFNAARGHKRRPGSLGESRRRYERRKKELFYDRRNTRR